jgi:hypothetical protein
MLIPVQNVYISLYNNEIWPFKPCTLPKHVRVELVHREIPVKNLYFPCKGLQCVWRVSAFECLLPDKSNLYLQKSPGYSRAQWYVSGSPYLKTTPPENSLAGRRYCGTQAINKSYYTSLSLTPCLHEAWRLWCEVFTSVASVVWLPHPWVDLLGRSAFHTSPWLLSQ